MVVVFLKLFFAKSSGRAVSTDLFGQSPFELFRKRFGKGVRYPVPNSVTLEKTTPTLFVRLENDSTQKSSVP